MRFLAKVTTPTGIKYIPNCTIFNGKVVGIVNKGIGNVTMRGGIGLEGDGDVWEEYDNYIEEKRPYINSSLIPKSGLTRIYLLED